MATRAMSAPEIVEKRYTAPSADLQAVQIVMFSFMMFSGIPAGWFYDIFGPAATMLIGASIAAIGAGVVGSGTGSELGAGTGSAVGAGAGSAVGAGTGTVVGAGTGGAVGAEVSTTKKYEYE